MLVTALLGLESTYEEFILLTEKGKKLFITEWEEKVKTTIKHRDLNKEVSYRRLIRMELYKLQKHLMGEKKYEPFEALW